MVDDPFDQVEQTEADQERAGEQLGRPSDVPATGLPPQNHQPHPDEDVRGRVEQAIPEGVDLQVLDAGRGIARVGQHMVPLQDLMQDGDLAVLSELLPAAEAGLGKALCPYTGRLG